MQNRLATELTTISDLHHIADCWEYLAGRAHPHIRLGRHMNKSRHFRNIAIGRALQTISGNFDCCLLREEDKKLIAVVAFAPYT